MTATGRFQHSITLTGEKEEKLNKIRATGKSIMVLVNEAIEREYKLLKKG